ncbi:hypothetical protein [Nocardioides marmoribigeumensis]|uniref:Uncharacterized protein n=1 Tax=Nocardioides marmoribigeumensis TaxID=433649 RepID=A0ABU2BWR6_9ACTN|nr:hypothetical protein [Nocardioides marmoribigeumensis]MDR7362759.1 hypothetical protein [Nocardioides marmoribigeumensis]
MPARLVRPLGVLLVVLLTTAGAISTSAAAASTYVVTAKPNKTNLVLGQAVVFTGSVSPRASGKTVVLQKRYRTTDAWTNERTATIANDGTFRVTDRPSSLKPRYYRVRKPASSTIGAGVSPTSKVLIYKWHYLTDLSSVDDNDMDTEVTVTINGDAYRKSMYADWLYLDGDASFIEWNLSRKCSRMVGTFGLSDDSETGSRANIEVSGDGNTLYSRDFDLGVSERRTLAVGNVLRVRFEFTALAYPDVYPAVGSARVLCRF